MKKQALLIGINEYEILPQLRYARQDAESVEQSLKYHYCFSDDEVMLLTDARAGQFKPSNQVRILNHLDSLANQNLDLFIFGFWGHGVVRNGKRYLCPLDVSPDDVEKLGVPFDVLLDKLSKIRAKNTCLILDCCQRVYNGERGEEETFTADDQKTIENAARDIIFRRKEQEPEFVSNVAILNSCKVGQAAYEWDDRKHGIFTAHLLDAMNRRFDSVAQIASYVSSNVEKTAMELNKQQTPLCCLEGSIPLPVETKTVSVQTGDVFVSYRHSNFALVKPIEDELKKRGISYFIDYEGVDYMDVYATVIAQAVKECKVLLFVWTQDADGSHDILREVSMALALQKRVLPYKIGTFNVEEHNSLFYQLSPISRYEVSNQTPETIVELVNQVQRALTDKTYQQYSIVLPPNSQDAVIHKPVIEDINVSVTPRIIEQKEEEIKSKIHLPPKPIDLLNIPAENEKLQEAIDQLISFTHESLLQANAAVAQAQAQFDAWNERREERWSDLPKKTRKLWRNTIADNPACKVENVVQQGYLSNEEYRILVEKFQCGKKYQQAEYELGRVERERKSKCDEAIAKLRKKIDDNNQRYDDLKSKFLDEVLLIILSVMGKDVFDIVSAPYPEDINTSLKELDEYNLGWREQFKISRARWVWENLRPCVISSNKQHIKVEKERKRKKERTEMINGCGCCMVIVALVLLIIWLILYFSGETSDISNYSTIIIISILLFIVGVSACNIKE